MLKSLTGRKEQLCSPALHKYWPTCWLSVWDWSEPITRFNNQMLNCKQRLVTQLRFSSNHWALIVQTLVCTEQINQGPAANFFCVVVQLTKWILTGYKWVDVLVTDVIKASQSTAESHFLQRVKTLNYIQVIINSVAFESVIFIYI